MINIHSISEQNKDTNKELVVNALRASYNAISELSEDPFYNSTKELIQDAIATMEVL